MMIWGRLTSAVVCDNTERRMPDAGEKGRCPTEVGKTFTMARSEVSSAGSWTVGGIVPVRFWSPRLSLPCNPKGIEAHPRRMAG